MVSGIRWGIDFWVSYLVVGGLLYFIGGGN